MNERLKELAEQAGFDVEDRTNEIWFDEGWYTSIVERFANLVRQDEREANAKLLNDFAKTTMIPVVDSFKSGLKAGSYAILSRGNDENAPLP
jgi:hypothetical protein